MKIVTQTANRWEIPNNQHAGVAGNEAALEIEISRRYPTVRIRSHASARYNCHGLTFAARRTCIDEATSIARILNDDGYSEVPLAHVLPGDVVLYFSDNFPSTVEHSGIVVALGVPPLNYPMVISKWGLIGPEVVHWAHECAYPLNLKYYRINVASERKLIESIVLRG